MECTNRACIESELDLHELGTADEHAAPIAGCDLQPGRCICLREQCLGHQMARPSGANT
jgi:hypothetical protein